MNTAAYVSICSRPLPDEYRWERTQVYIHPWDKCISPGGVKTSWVIPPWKIRGSEISHRFVLSGSPTAMLLSPFAVCYYHFEKLWVHLFGEILNLDEISQNTLVS